MGSIGGQGLPSKLLKEPCPPLKIIEMPSPRELLKGPCPLPFLLHLHQLGVEQT